MEEQSDDCSLLLHHIPFTQREVAAMEEQSDDCSLPPTSDELRILGLPQWRSSRTTAR